MKKRLKLLAPVLALLFFLPGYALQSSHRQVLPQTVDPPFVFEGPLPASRPVAADWFSDALFIGDARLEALTGDGLFPFGLSLARMGLNVRDVRSSPVFPLGDGRATLEQMLEGANFRKVYLMLGFNEASWMSEEEFYGEYSALIDELRRFLPGAQIYVETLIPVTVSRDAASTTDNALLAQRSALLIRLARNKRVYLVNVGEHFTGVNGALSPSLSSDGLHLTAEGNEQWFRYLRTHTMGT